MDGSFEQLRAINERCRQMKIWDIVAILGIALGVLAVSHWNQYQEIFYIRDSLSTFYNDFDKSILTHPGAMRELMNKASSVVNNPNFLKIHEIRAASEKLNNQIEILTNFEHDKTGRPDLALWNSGGRIAGLGMDTETFYSCSWFWKLAGCPNKINGPEKTIQESMKPGECFRFKGKVGKLFIRLINKAIVDGITVEHITKKISPTGDITCAPRKFLVAGLNRQDEIPFMFGNFTFNANKTSIEMFFVNQRSSIPHKYVMFHFLDNNGDSEETCVYRLRIHGILIQGYVLEFFNGSNVQTFLKLRK
ncbi:CLUMA_CG014156, isoform A [Clunio marinus]|uniref:CLUMA_CG014156, isoform A n=1 Tax=Clunio marinus TaxID=568069 RepID=A0A1J1IME1_9DIPT|nr:CLUMA_CG014156, isoform A [Clunio marinus]